METDFCYEKSEKVKVYKNGVINFFQVQITPNKEIVTGAEKANVQTALSLKNFQQMLLLR